MPTPAVTLALIVTAVAADGAGAHHAASWLVLVAIPIAAAVAFAAAGDFVEEKTSLPAALCPALVLMLLVLASAVRSNAVEGGHVPRLALSALAACVALYGLQALAVLVWPPPRPQAARSSK
jgi:anti-sigma-K factor RskA